MNNIVDIANGGMPSKEDGYFSTWKHLTYKIRYK